MSLIQISMSGEELSRRSWRSEKDGKHTFDMLTAGKYLLSATSLRHEPFEQTLWIGARERREIELVCHKKPVGGSIIGTLESATGSLRTHQPIGPDHAAQGGRGTRPAAGPAAVGPSRGRMGVLVLLRQPAAGRIRVERLGRPGNLPVGARRMRVVPPRRTSCSCDGTTCRPSTSCSTSRVNRPKLRRHS